MNLAKNLHTLFVIATSTTGLSKEERTRFQHFSLFLLFGIPLMLVFGITNFRNGDIWVSAFAALSATCLSIGWLLIKYSEKGIIVYRFNAVLYASLLLYLLIYGGESGSKILWLYTFPFITFFLFGKNEGLIWSTITIILTFFLFFIPRGFLEIYPYHIAFKIRFFASYVTVTGVTFWLEYLRHSYSTKLEAQNEALNDEIVERKRIEKERERLIAEVQSANRAKSEFLANMSHEIRTPLNGVIGMTSMLLDTKLDEHQIHYATTLRTSGEFLLTIINDILDVSKIEAGKFELNIKPFDLREMLDRFSAIATQKIYNSNVELIVWADPEIPSHVGGDADRLQQILINLTSNALKFTPEGHVTVKVSTREESPSHILLLFSVKDTGIGIADEDQPKLFHSFSQIDTPTTREYCGTGLGLNISKQLCERMGGEIGVSSTAGHGSEFWFTARLEKCAPAGEQHPSPDLHGKSVMIAAANEMLTEMLNRQISYWGATVHCTSTPEMLMQEMTKQPAAMQPGDFLFIDQACLVPAGEERLQQFWKSVAAGQHRLILLAEAGELLPEIAKTVTDQAVILKKPIQFGELRLCCSDEQRSAEPIFSSDTTAMTQSLREVKILLAEDNPINREVLVGILAKSGIEQVDTVDNGLDVLKALEQKKYHLILMDVSMPKMDGLTVTGKIRTSTFTHNSSTIPIIALTAHAIAGDRERCLQAGMNDYLTKPIKPQELLHKLDMWLPQGSLEPVSQPTAVTALANNTAPEELLQFDSAAMLHRLMGDNELARQIMNMFLDDAPEQLKILENLINSRSLQQASDQAHKIAGAASNLSVNRFHAITKTIEAECRDNNADMLDALLTDLKNEFQKVRKEILHFLQDSA